MRNRAIDMMKGFALLLMFIGHIAIPNPVHSFIYSFHMPLFFIVSGYFAKSLDEKGQSFAQALRKDCRQLLLPYFITALAVIAFTALRSIVKNDWSIMFERAYDLFYASDSAGPIWFLLVLFWCRVLFRFLMKYGRWTLLIVTAISGAAVLVAHHMVQLPFCILTALSLMVFYTIGWWHRTYGVPKWLIWVCILCWPIIIAGPEINFYYMKWGIYPLTILGACGGTYVMYRACEHIVKYVNTNQNESVKLWRRLLYVCMYVCVYVGVNSLVILCFHTFDLHCCYVTMLSYGIFGIQLSYPVTVLLRNGAVFLLSWLYISYIRPYIERIKNERVKVERIKE